MALEPGDERRARIRISKPLSPTRRSNNHMGRAAIISGLPLSGVKWPSPIIIYAPQTA
jgi:hypothetical protein